MYREGHEFSWCLAPLQLVQNPLLGGACLTFGRWWSAERCPTPLQEKHVLLSPAPAGRCLHRLVAWPNFLHKMQKGCLFLSWDFAGCAWDVWGLLMAPTTAFSGAGVPLLSKFWRCWSSICCPPMFDAWYSSTRWTLWLYCGLFNDDFILLLSTTVAAKLRYDENIVWCFLEACSNSATEQLFITSSVKASNNPMASLSLCFSSVYKTRSADALGKWQSPMIYAKNLCSSCSRRSRFCWVKWFNSGMFRYAFTILPICRCVNIVRSGTWL